MSQEEPNIHERIGTAAQPNTAPRSPDIAALIPTTPGGGQVRAWALGGERYWGISESLPRLPAGCYDIGISQSVGVFLNQHPLRTDALLRLPDSKTEEILAEIQHFATLRGAFVKRGLLFKRGVLLWGPPGSGKTCALHLLIQTITEQLGGIALLVDHPTLASQAMQLVRQIEPDRQIVAVLEDLDAMVQVYGENQYLSLLDGEAQVNDIVFVATTNYPERLDKRFVDRPSRFDTVAYVGMPSPAARRAYLRYKEPDLPAETIDRMVAISEGMSIAHLRELIVLTQCFGRSIEEAEQRLTQSRKKTPHSERAPGWKPPGFEVSHQNSQRTAYRSATGGGITILPDLGGPT